VGTDRIDRRPDLRLAAAAALLLAGSCGSLVLWAASVRDRLPDPVAHHWGRGGVADGFSSLSSTLWVTVGLLLVITLPMVLAAVFARQPAALRRCLAGTAAWLAVFMTVLVADSLRGQLDLADAAAAPAPGPGILVGVVAGLIAAAGFAALVRSDPASGLALGPPPSSAPRVEGRSLDLPWTAAPGGLDRAAAVIGVVATVGILALAAVVSWWLVSIALLVAVLFLGIGRLVTCVDEDGLSVRALGRRLLHVPLDHVAGAEVIEVDPFWEFGGWGLRVDMAGRTGLVTRKGEALQVLRGDGSEVVVTVDDAARAAAILNTLADRLQDADARRDGHA
jgi:hypothetical protein